MVAVRSNGFELNVFCFPLQALDSDQVKKQRAEKVHDLSVEEVEPASAASAKRGREKSSPSGQT